MNNPWPKFYIIGHLPWPVTAILIPKDGEYLPKVASKLEIVTSVPELKSNVISLFGKRASTNDNDNDLTNA